MREWLRIGRGRVCRLSFDNEVMTRLGRRVIVVKGNEVAGGGEGQSSLSGSFQYERRGVSDADRIDAQFYRQCRNSFTSRRSTLPVN